jgi:hypothetical protein
MPVFIEKIVLEDFISKVRKMRDLQKLYFKDRLHGQLALAKAAEKDVDQALLQQEKLL